MSKKASKQQRSVFKILQKTNAQHIICMYLRMDHSNFEVKIKTQSFEEFWGTQNGVEFRSNFWTRKLWCLLVNLKQHWSYFKLFFLLETSQIPQCLISRMTCFLWVKSWMEQNNGDHNWVNLCQFLLYNNNKKKN